MENDVIEFIARHERIDIDKLSMQTLLFDDLDLDGDDAADLISSFSQKFSVDLSEFEFGRYFGEEGLPPWFLVTWAIILFKRLLGKTAHEAAGLEPFPIQKLVRAVEDGRLV